MYASNLNANSTAEKEARKNASKKAEKEDSHIPRSLKKSEAGRKQDAAYRKEMQKAHKKANKNRDFAKGRNQLWDENDLEAVQDAAFKNNELISSDNESDSGDDSEDNIEQENESPANTENTMSSTPEKSKAVSVEKKKIDDKKDIYYIPYRPADLDDRDSKFLSSKLTQLLKKWATNLNMDHAKACRNLLAVWHPDKQRFSEHHDEVNDIFQILQGEIKRLQDEKARRMKKFESHIAQRSETQESKATERVVKGKNTNTKENTFAPASRGHKVKSLDSDDSDSDDCPDLVEVEEQECADIEGRSHFSMTCVNDKCLVFGGEAVNRATGNPKFFGDLFSIEKIFENNSDENNENIFARELPSISGTENLKTSNAPSMRSAHQSVTLGDNLFVFGGEWTSPDGRRFKQFDDLWRFNLKLNTWSKVNYNKEKKTHPCGRSGHRVTVLGTKLFVFGGFVEQKNGNLKYLNDFYCIDLKAELETEAGENLNPNSLVWIADKRKNVTKPSARSGFSMWSDENENKIYVFGGTSMDSKGNLKVASDCWCFDVESYLWEKVEQTNVKEFLHYNGMASKIRTNMAVCKPKESSMFDDKVIFFGGVTDVETENLRLKRKGISIFHNDILTFDYKNGTWSRVAVNEEISEAIDNNTSEEVLENSEEKFVPQLSQAYCESDAKNEAKKLREQELLDAEEIVPRGRIAAQIACYNNSLVVFAGSCESELAKKEKTIDDLWKVDLSRINDNENINKPSWECVWQLSANAKPDAGDDTDSDTDDEAVANARINVANSKKAATVAAKSIKSTNEPVVSQDMSLAPVIVVAEKPSAVKFQDESDDSEEENSEEDDNKNASSKKKGGKKLSKKAQKKAEKEKSSEKSSISYNAEDTETNKNVNTVSLVDVTDPSTLSKKERVKWEKKQRQEVKIVKQMEKEAKKNQKKEAKLEKQKNNGKKKGGDDDENDSE